MCKPRLGKSAVVLFLTVTFLAAVGIFILDTVHHLYNLNWHLLPHCGNGENFLLADTVCILFVGSPRFSQKEGGIGWPSRTVYRRYLRNTFEAAYKLVTPDIVAFIGDFDEMRGLPDQKDLSIASSEFKDIFAVPESSQVLQVAGEAAAGYQWNSYSNALKDPTKLKFLDIMVWPREKDPNAGKHISSLKDFSADYLGSVQMLISYESPLMQDGYRAVSSRLKPHIIFSVSDKQVSHQLCAAGDRPHCSGTGRRLFGVDAEKYHLRDNASTFVHVTLPSCCAVPDNNMGPGYMAAQIDLFGEVTMQVVWTPTQATLIFWYMVVVAASVAITYGITRQQVRVFAFAPIWLIGLMCHKMTRCRH